jgi:site-specific DNA recombinase
MESCKRKKVGIWIRVSTQEQNKADSPEIHEARAKTYAKFKDWVVIEKYELCVSGKSIMDHPETQRMLNDVETGHIHALIFSKLARLGRNARELMDFCEFFRKHNVDLISLGENFDTSTASGELFYNLIAIFAQWERRETSERILASVKTRAKQGQPLGGIAPFGYIWRGEKLNKKLEVYADEVTIVKEIFNTFIKCRKIKTTAKTLNNQGYRTKKGRLWSDTSISRLLKNTTYKGIHYLNYTKTKPDGKSWETKPKEKWQPVEVEHIVSEQVWEQANAILKMNSNRRIRRQNVYLLTGLVHCSKCGAKMYGYDYERSKGYYRCSKCSGKIQIKEIENLLIKNLMHYKFNTNQLEGLPHASAKELEKKLSNLKRELKNVQSKIDKLLDLYHKNVISELTFSEQVTKLEERQTQIHTQIPIQEEELQTAQLKTQKKELTHYIKSIGSVFNTLDFKAQRAIVEDLVHSININDNNIEMNFYLLNFFKKNLVEDRKINKPAWIHCRCEHKSRRICQRDFCPADRYRTVFKRLS